VYLSQMKLLLSKQGTNTNSVSCPRNAACQSSAHAQMLSVASLSKLNTFTGMPPLGLQQITLIDVLVVETECKLLSINQ